MLPWLWWVVRTSGRGEGVGILVAGKVVGCEGSAWDAAHGREVVLKVRSILEVEVKPCTRVQGFCKVSGHSVPRQHGSAGSLSHRSLCSRNAPGSPAKPAEHYCQHHTSSGTNTAQEGMRAAPHHGVILGLQCWLGAAARPGECPWARWAALTVGNAESHISSVLGQHCLVKLCVHRPSWHSQLLQCLLDFIFATPAARSVGACTQQAVIPGYECGAGLQSCRCDVFGAAGVQEEGELLQEQTHPSPLPQE